MHRILALAVVATFMLTLPNGAYAAAPCVDVEKASVRDIQSSLQGAGPKVAKAIVDYRKRQRAAATKAGKRTWNFKNWKTLLRVPGLGPSFCKNNVAKVCFSGKVQRNCPK